MTAVFRRVGTALIAAVVVPLAASAGQQAVGGPCHLPGYGVNGAPLRYRLANDGTVIDGNTGLAWEMKDDSGGIHNVDRSFTWSSTGTAPDGTAFTIFLDTLNNTCAGNETMACS